MDPRGCTILFLTTLVALFLQEQVGASIIGNVLPGKYYERIYDRIGAHLATKAGYDSYADMNEAIEWLKSRISSAKFDAEKKSLTMVLDQLKALERLKNDEKCDLDSYKVLYANSRGTRGSALKLHHDSESKNRITKLVHHYFVLHAESCKQHYFNLFNSGEGMNKSDLEMVKTIRDGLIRALVDNGARQLWLIRSPRQAPKPVWRPTNPLETNTEILEGLETYKFVMNFRPSIGEVENPESILNHLSRDDPDNKCLAREEGKDLDSDKVKALYMKYMVDPCKKYIKQKASVWKMYTFDLTLINMLRDKLLLGTTIGFEMCFYLANRIQISVFNRMIEKLSK